jgi:hypothetical protein
MALVSTDLDSNLGSAVAYEGSPVSVAYHALHKCHARLGAPFWRHRKRRGMNAGSRRGISPDFRHWVAAEQHRKEAERARKTAKQAASAGDRAFWLALAENWEKLAKEAEAPKIRLWAI